MTTLIGEVGIQEDSTVPVPWKCPLQGLPLPRSPPPRGSPSTLHSLSIHAQHHAQGGVTASGKMVSVPAHADGVQPVPDGEAPAATPAPSEVKTAPGEGGGWAPAVQGPLLVACQGCGLPRGPRHWPPPDLLWAQQWAEASQGWIPGSGWGGAQAGSGPGFRQTGPETGFSPGLWSATRPNQCWAGGRYLPAVAVALRLSGLRISASRTLTMWEKRGRWARSLCQQSSMSWCRARGQPMGAGSRYPSSTELMTCSRHSTGLGLCLPPGPTVLHPAWPPNSHPGWSCSSRASRHRPAPPT